MKTAVITGSTGQDGSYLADFLLEKDYKVVGVVRRSSSERFDRIEHIRDRITLEEADLQEFLDLIDTWSVKFAELYATADAGG